MLLCAHPEARESPSTSVVALTQALAWLLPRRLLGIGQSLRSACPGHVACRDQYSNLYPQVTWFPGHASAHRVMLSQVVSLYLTSADPRPGRAEGFYLVLQREDPQLGQLARNALPTPARCWAWEGWMVMPEWTVMPA